MEFNSTSHQHLHHHHLAAVAAATEQAVKLWDDAGCEVTAETTLVSRLRDHSWASLSSDTAVTVLFNSLLSDFFTRSIVSRAVGLACQHSFISRPNDSISCTRTHAHHQHRTFPSSKLNTRNWQQFTVNTKTWQPEEDQQRQRQRHRVQLWSGELNTALTTASMWQPATAHT